MTDAPFRIVPPRHHGRWVVARAGTRVMAAVTLSLLPLGGISLVLIRLLGIA